MYKSHWDVFVTLKNEKNSIKGVTKFLSKMGFSFTVRVRCKKQEDLEDKLILSLI